MTAKIPTASGISRLLATAGFDRSEQDNRALTLRSGFKVTKDSYRNAVRVRHCFLLRGDAKPYLAKYAKTITEAGWTVESGTYELIVTAREGD